MEKETKVTLYVILLPIIWLLISLGIVMLLGGANILLSIISEGLTSEVPNFMYLLILSLVLICAFPLALSLIVGTKILPKSKILGFIIPLILIPIFSLVLYSVVLRTFLYENWFLHECCGVCDFGNGEIFLIIGIIVLNLLSIIVSFFSLLFIHRILKKEEDINKLMK